MDKGYIFMSKKRRDQKKHNRPHAVPGYKDDFGEIEFDVPYDESFEKVRHEQRLKMKQADKARTPGMAKKTTKAPSRGKKTKTMDKSWDY